MTAVKDEYVTMMQHFLDGNIPTPDFEKSYLSKFKNEPRNLDDKEFEILDALFGDIDAYTSDASLIAENPNFYVNESQLRESVAMAVKKLK